MPRINANPTKHAKNKYLGAMPLGAEIGYNIMS